MSHKLAIHGGVPVRDRNFPAYNVISQKEIDEVRAVMESGVLSRYLGTWHPDFYGGPKVQAFEDAWNKAFKISHSVSVNSATSGLYAAVGAANLGEGDEVIVSPYTMSASATAPLVYGACPVFADIDPATGCITADTIRARLTERTKAIIVVHIFGGAADMAPIMELAREHDLIVIEDCAQAPTGVYQGQMVGSIGHMGVFSLNYHKHIHTGEGGLVVTDDDVMADRLRLIRNHSEAVIDRMAEAGRDVGDMQNLVGFNYRLGEIEAAIGLSLLDRLDDLIDERLENIRYLEGRLEGLNGLQMPVTREGDKHCHYVHTMRYDETITGVRREDFIEAVKAELKPCDMRSHEGVLLFQGYVRPLYLQSLYQQKRHPALKQASDMALESYAEGACPNCEHAHFKSVITHELMRPGLSKEDLDDVADAFIKVYENLNQLAPLEQAS